MKFRKKPIEIEAAQMPSEKGWKSETPVLRAPQWLLEAMEKGHVYYLSDKQFAVRTLEGQMTGNTGDWIIQGIAGELYPCKREIFMATYERMPTGIPLLGS